MTWPNPVFISTPFLKVFIKLVKDSCIFLLNYLVEFVPFCLYVNKCCTFCNTFSVSFEIYLSSAFGSAQRSGTGASATSQLRWRMRTVGGKHGKMGKSREHLGCSLGTSSGETLEGDNAAIFVFPAWSSFQNTYNVDPKTTSS